MDKVLKLGHRQAGSKHISKNVTNVAKNFSLIHSIQEARQEKLEEKARLERLIVQQSSELDQYAENDPERYNHMREFFALFLV